MNEFLERMIFGERVTRDGAKKAVEEIKKNINDSSKEIIKEFKDQYGKDYKIYMKREDAANYFEIADWLLMHKKFKENKEEIIEEAEKLAKEALALLEAIK